METLRLNDWLIQVIVSRLLLFSLHRAEWIQSAGTTNDMSKPKMRPIMWKNWLVIHSPFHDTSLSHQAQVFPGAGSRIHQCTSQTTWPYCMYSAVTEQWIIVETKENEPCQSPVKVAWWMHPIKSGEGCVSPPHPPSWHHVVCHTILWHAARLARLRGSLIPLQLS